MELKTYSPERLDTKEAMEFIGCSKSKLFDLLRRGKLKGTYFKIGNRYIFIKDKLIDWMLNGGEEREDKLW